MRSPYDAVVFAGGGCRCLWQVGFWQVVAPAIGLAPRVVGSVSAGAAMVAGRDYVQPSQPVPIHKWDYTRPDLVQATYDLGQRDGERFLRAARATERPGPAARAAPELRACQRPH